MERWHNKKVPPNSLIKPQNTKERAERELRGTKAINGRKAEVQQFSATQSSALREHVYSKESFSQRKIMAAKGSRGPPIL